MGQLILLGESIVYGFWMLGTAAIHEYETVFNCLRLEFNLALSDRAIPIQCLPFSYLSS